MESNLEVVHVSSPIDLVKWGDQSFGLGLIHDKPLFINTFNTILLILATSRYCVTTRVAIGRFYPKVPLCRKENKMRNLESGMDQGRLFGPIRGNL